MGRLFSTGRMRRGALLFSLLLMVATMIGGGAAVSAQEEAPSPQLPILLLNGSIYPSHFDMGSLPPSFRVDGYPSSTTALYLVQCREPIKEKWVDEFLQIGGELRGYLPYNTLLVAMDGAAHSRLGEIDSVNWSGLFQPYFKISPALQLRLDQGGEVTVLAELFSAKYLQDTINSMSTMPVEVLGAEADATGAVAALRMPVEALNNVAALPAVEWIELCTTGTLPAAFTGAEEEEKIGGTPPVGDVGEGVVGLGDTGLGTGSLQGVPGEMRGNILDLSSFRGDNGGDVNGHGTAVAGAVLGVENSATNGGALSRIGLIAYATGYGLGCPPVPLSLFNLLGTALASGVEIYISGSVPEGRESLGAYGIYTFQRDAAAWYNPNVVLVEAAGNEGTDANGDGVVDKGSLLGGAAAKNVMSIGGTESAPAGGDGAPALTYGELQGIFTGKFPAQPLKDDSSVGEPAGMAAFSSRGPTRDGRIKPDLVAPATNVLTAASGGPESAPGLVYAGTGGYVRAYGTSMAAAAVARYVSSLRGFLKSNRGEDPSAALLKAFLVNGAADLAPGQYGSDNAEIPPAPNVVEGWGSANPGAAESSDSWAKVIDDREGLRVGESRVFKIDVPAGKQLRVTLTWTDYPSLPEARLHLVNDLDLRVTDPDGVSFYPNGRSSRDPLNNVERVTIDSVAEAGEYAIEITAWNVPFSPQPFALVAQTL